MNLPLFIKLPIIFSTMVAFSAAAVGLMSFATVSQSLLEKAQNELSAEGVLSSIRIRDALEIDHSQAVSLAYDSAFRDFFTEFNNTYEAYLQNGGISAEFSNSEEFMAARSRNFSYLSSLKRSLAFSSYYLVNLDGIVVFAEDPTSGLKNNLGTSLLDGEFSGTEVSQVLGQVLPKQDGTAPDRESAQTPYITSELTPDPIKSLYAVPVQNASGGYVGAILFAKNGNDASRAMIKDLDGANSDRFLLGAKGELLLATMPRAQASAALSSIGNLDEALLDATLGDGNEVVAATIEFKVGDEAYKLVSISNTDAVRGETNSLAMLLFIQTLIITALTAAVGVFIARRNVAPIREMRGHFHTIADTLDLSYRVNSNKRDEIGSAVRALDRIMVVLDNAVGRIGDQSKNVDVVISSLNESTQSLAYNAEVQNSAVEELSSSVEQTASQVRSNAQSAQSANDSATRMKTTVSKGKARVDKMVEAMTDIRVSSDEISRIIKVIDDIAFQTNLLALNAAVEAARAGSQGRGFAVVASEVRNLAGRSTKAAKETQQLIEQAANRVSAGVEISEETKASFEDIASDIEFVSSLMADISRASEEQAHGVESVNLAINEIARYASNSTLEAEKIARTSENLIRANRELRNEIGRFSTTSGGTTLASTVQAGAPEESPVTELALKGAA